MTFLELCRAVRTECSVAGVGPDTVAGQTGTYAKLVNWVRQANTEIQNRYFNWKFLFRTYTHTPEVMGRSFADDINSPNIEAPVDLNVWVKDSFRLDGKRVDAVEYHDKAFAINSMGARPYVVIMPDNSLVINNKREGFPNLVADYYCKPQVLKSNTDTPYFPEQFHYLIIYRSMMMYGNYDNAIEIKSAGIEGWQEMMPILEANQLPLHSETLMPNQQELVVRVE